MKHTTKVKIINWVKKILRYNETNQIPLVMEVKVENIHKVHYIGRFNENDPETYLLKLISLEIAKECISKGFLTFNKKTLDKNKYFEQQIEIEAILMVIK